MKIKALAFILQFIVLPLIIVLLLLIIFHGTFLPKKYLNPWNKEYHSKYDDPRIQVIAHGLLAPNAHNMQSWRIVLDKDNKMKFTLYLDEKRLLPATDPYHRQSVISQGTFLELADIAAKKLGYRLDISLYPKGTFGNEPTMEQIHDTPTAIIELKKDNEIKNPLYDPIFKRITARTEYLDKPLTQDQIDQLLALNGDPDFKVLIFQNSEELEYLKKLTIEGSNIESQLEKTMRESSVVLRYSEYQKNKYRYGLTLSSQGWPKLKQFVIESIASIIPTNIELEGSTWRKLESERIKKTPAFLMIISNKNDRITQVKLGRLYARLQLMGTALNLSMQPTTQVVQEYEEMKKLYDEITDKFAEKGEIIHLLIRVGEGTKQLKHSPRMDVMQIIE